MDKIRIQCSPLTGTIYAGKINKAGDGWSGQKVDVTSDVLGAIIQKVGVGNVLSVTENALTGTQYEISVRIVKPEASPADASLETSENEALPFAH